MRLSGAKAQVRRLTGGEQTKTVVEIFAKKQVERSAGNMPPRLEVVRASKRFGLVVALDVVSMTLDPWEFHALLGENGAGKSTLVKCVMGYHRFDAGTVKLGDQVRKQEHKELMEQGQQWLKMNL